MRNIAEIIKDDRNGKQLSQTERQIAVAYIQGKYDAVMELKNGNNSNVMEVLEKTRTEIEKEIDRDDHADEYCDGYYDGMKKALAIIDKYKAESEVEK